MYNRVDNFKGNIHRFTTADSIKGGKSRSELKINAARFNSIKTGNYTKGVKYCSICLLAQFCQQYQDGHNKKCTVVKPKTLKQVMSIKGFKTTQEYDRFIFDMTNDFKKIEKAKNAKELNFIVGRIIEFVELKRRLRP